MNSLTLSPPRRVILPDTPGKILCLRAEVTVAEFAEATGLSHGHVRKLIDMGKIKARTLDPENELSHKRIPFDELRRYLAL